MSQKPSTEEKLSIKDYEVVKQLGSGSFGKVRLVKKKGQQTLYALKSVLMNRLNQKEKDNALNQIRLLASIDIPTVIKYEGSFFNLQTNELCILMEYADGGDLQNKVIERQDVSPDDGFQEKGIWKVAYELLLGLKNLHQNNIIHRDLKSANVFFVKGVAKLGDMNVSKLTQDGLCSTQTGTPYYTSPQVWSGQKYGSKCDIWSLGCLLYQLCALRVPFKAQDFPGLYRRITKGEYSQVPQKYSANMKSLIKKCLTVDEEIRPSAQELLSLQMFKGYEKQYEELKGGEVNILESIKCPKVLRFLNSRLPKPMRTQKLKKTVGFAMMEEKMMSVKKENGHARHIRSQKVIKWSQEDVMKAPRQVIKLPPVGEKETPSHQNAGNGLYFSSKKLKVKPTSTKLIMG